MEDVTEKMKTKSLFVEGKYSVDKLYDVTVFGQPFEQISYPKLNMLQLFVWLANMASVPSTKIKFHYKSWLLYCEYNNTRQEGAKDDCFIGLNSQFQLYDEELEFL